MRRKRRSTFKRRFGRKRRRTSSFAPRVKRVIRSAQQHKWINSSQPSVEIGSATTAQYLASLATPPIGSSRTTRIGNQMVIKSLQFRGSVVGGVAIETPVKVRVIIFVEKKPTPVALTPAVLNGGPTSQLTLFANPDTSGSFSWIAMLNPDTVPSRYRVLRDFVVKMNITSAVAASNTSQVIYWKKNIRFKTGLKQTFNDTASGSTAVNNNLIWVYMTTDQALATGPNIEYDCVVRYSDI